MSIKKTTLLEALLSPLTLDDLKEHYADGRCFVVEGKENKFEGLVTLDDIERRLNDGCNASVFAQAIKDGNRRADVDANVGWSPGSLRKAELLSDIQSGHSFMMANSSQVSKGLSALCDQLEAFFSDDHVHADVHLYVSMDDSGNSYNAHRDLPQHKLLVQAIGSANWQLFDAKKEIPNNIMAMTPETQDEYLELASEFTLSQGDLLYMPPGVFHKVVNVPGPRVSVSIPFYSMPAANRMDRTHIPFAKMFEASL